MWKSVTYAFDQGLMKSTSFLTANICLHEQIRTTYVLKRRFAPLLHKKGSAPKPLKGKHYVYDLIKDTSVERQPDVDVILTTNIEGLGNTGEKVSVKAKDAYNNLLLPGLAVYASNENIEKYKDLLLNAEEKVKFSSVTAPLTMRSLSLMTLSVVMNKDNPWTIQPWHIRTSFRKCGFVVPEDAITIPEIPIKGSDMNLEGKEFYVTITINNIEKVNVRCRLHHWSTNIVDRIPHEHNFWEQSKEPIHPEFEEILNEIPKKRHTS